MINIILPKQNGAAARSNLLNVQANTGLSWNSAASTAIVENVDGVII